ncbi:MAG: ABC transporter permease [Puniceicoccales bacterium]|jgi:putative ABC transport system permease protein|nr:ABC transporter permease [Puniceicoccales bacterium]
MNLCKIVFRSLRQHALSTIITAASIALAGGLLMSVWSVKRQAQATFTQVNTGFDAVLGARGSQLQLVLNSIFHLENSPGNIRWTDYEYIRDHPSVKIAVPIAVGDNLRGWRIVGAIPEIFTEVEYARDRKFSFASGRNFAPTAREAVLGSYAAAKLGMKVGDTFKPAHGLDYVESHEHPEVYTIVGILAASNTPVDKVVWIPIQGVQTMTGHDPKAATDVSAVLVKLKTPQAGFSLSMMYNRQGDKLTFAYPIGRIMGDLFRKISWFDRILELVAYLVALVSAGGVLASIYNSMSARRRDIAILRALGARRRTIFSAIILEAAAIGTVGMIASFFVYAVILNVVAVIVRAQTGVVIDPWIPEKIMLIVPPAMIALCGVCGLIPAWKAYRTDIAENLTPLS